MGVRRRWLVLVVTALALAGCGYAMAGTWDDDPGNWGRAFSSTKPPDVEVLHSKYWRSAHWTFEFQYFFHLRRNDPLRRQLIEQNKLVRLEGEAASKARSDSFGENPAWFLPGGIGEYEVWVIGGNPNSHFRLFFRKATGDLFLADWQA